MTNIEKPVAASQPGLSPVSIPSAGKLEAILGSMDLAMMLAAFLGLCLIVATVAVMAVIDLARLASNLWSNHDDRWLIVFFGMVVIWVAVRRKKLRV